MARCHVHTPSKHSKETEHHTGSGWHSPLV